MTSATSPFLPQHRDDVTRVPPWRQRQRSDVGGRLSSANQRRGAGGAAVQRGGGGGKKSVAPPRRPRRPALKEAAPARASQRARIAQAPPRHADQSATRSRGGCRETAAKSGEHRETTTPGVPRESDSPLPSALRLPACSARSPGGNSLPSERRDRPAPPARSPQPQTAPAQRAHLHRSFYSFNSHGLGKPNAGARGTQARPTPPGLRPAGVRNKPWRPAEQLKTDLRYTVRE